MAVAPWAPADGGILYPTAQMPATMNSDGNLDANEVSALSVADYEVSP